MKLFRLFLVLLLVLGPFGARASDEIRGAVADVLSAIRNRRLGQTFLVSAVIEAPPAANDGRFVIRDSTGSVIIRRDLDWPEEPLHVGDAVNVRCEISSTARTPAGAYFRGLMVIARNPSPPDPHGNWLVTAQGDESAKVMKLPRGVTATNVTFGLGALIALSLSVLAWNSLLRRLIDRRSRELTTQRLAAFTADLKVEERTRLAIELHDTLAQTLAGVSLEIDAVRDFSKESPAEASRHLDIASRALASCRNELRNCLWDLRSQTLDNISMDEAIRQTLAPHLATASLTVRFNVDRAALSDSTALSILRIIRELTINAIRHGRASAIKVAGCIEGPHLLFSVTDNGCGFDPTACPGIEQGHFGLQGVVERVESLDGSLRIDSSRESGTHARIVIAIPKAIHPA